MISEELWNKLKKVHRNIYVLGLVSFWIQFGATLVYTTAEKYTSGFMTPLALLIMRSFSESTSTSIKILSGLINDYLKKPKLLLNLSYGYMIISKCMFLLCIILGNKLGPASKLISYVSYLYISMHLLDRIMASLRDVPQADMMLNSIKESNKYLIDSNNEVAANENILFSLSVRKAIASLGSVLGGIIAYCILKFNLLSGISVYILAIIPLIIGNIILYFGIQELKEKEEENYEQYFHTAESDYESEIIDIQEIKNEGLLIEYSKIIFDKLENNIHIFTMIYYIISAVVLYMIPSSKFTTTIFLVLYNLLFLSSNVIIATILRIGLLVSLWYGNNILIICTFIIGVYIAQNIINLYNNFNISNFNYMSLLFMGVNIIYVILFTVFGLLLVNPSYMYIYITLLAAHTFIYNYFKNLQPLYVTISLLVLAQLKVLLLTQNIYKYIMFTIISTLSVFNTNEYVFMIFPKQIMELVKYIAIANVPYEWLFNISFILSHISTYIYAGVITICKYLMHKQEGSIIKIGLDNISFGFETAVAANTIYKYKTFSYVCIGLFAMLLIFTFNFEYSLYIKMLICISGTVILSGILSYVYYNKLEDYFNTYKEYLYSFAVTVIILCMLHIGRCNDTFFFSHGTTYIKSVTTNEIPLIFTFLYLVITISSFLLSSLKKHKTLLFIIVGSSLIGAQVSLLWTTIPGFILALTCLGIYSSGNEVLFVSLIKEVIPSNSSNSIFLGIYYLCMSIATMLNAAISVLITLKQNMIVEYMSKISPIFSSFVFVKAILFIIFPMISMILWLIFKQDKKNINDI